jgi:hypothetical protein
LSRAGFWHDTLEDIFIVCGNDGCKCWLFCVNIAGDVEFEVSCRLLGGMRQGASEPIMEAPFSDADDARCAISASLAPPSAPADNIPYMSSNPTFTKLPRNYSPESLADALGNLSIPGDCSSSGTENSWRQSPPETTPKHAKVVGSSVSPSPCTPNPSSRVYRHSLSDHGARGSCPGSFVNPVMPRPVPLNTPSVPQHPLTPQQSRPTNPSSMFSQPRTPTPNRFEKLMPAGECVPLNVTHWSQDHSSVTIFLHLERFNPASLMVQIQQHMVVVMALNSDGPSHVFMMRPEHAVRVQGSKSRPQPGNGIQIVLQKRSPGNVWSSFGVVSTPQS